MTSSPRPVPENKVYRTGQAHRDVYHGGGECDCPLYVPPRCRLLLRVPRWSPRGGWRVGTPGLCPVPGYRSLRAALRVHRASHEAPY